MRRFAWRWSGGSEYQFVLSACVSPTLPALQKTLGPEQNPLRLQQNQELDQLLKEGSTFTVVDQPVSLDRLQLRNIDQLNASSREMSFSRWGIVWRILKK